MTSLFDLLNDGEKCKVGFNGNVTLITPKGLSSEEMELAKNYLSELKPKEVIKHLRDAEHLKGSEVKVFYIGNDPDKWAIQIGIRLFPLSACGYTPSAGHKPAYAAIPSQAL